ncbi:MAG: hypothetical protein AB8G05_21615 [Oligoflexales bacterium]
MNTKKFNIFVLVKNLLILLPLLFLSVNNARGEDELERIEYKYQIESHFVDLFRKINKDNIPSFETQDYHKSTWKYHAFIFRVRPRIGFNIPGMISLTMVPETEFYWAKKIRL